jgi:hypothetical protein
MMTQASLPRATRRGASVRTAVTLAGVALASFGAIVAEYAGSPQVGMGVLGEALVVFLLVAMTRRGRR